MSMTEIFHGPHTDDFREEIKERLKKRETTFYTNRRKDIGFIIGNGESRIGFDLNLLMPVGLVFGCNALYRDFSPDLLFCMDEGIIWEVKESGYHPFIYRERINGEIQGNLILDGYKKTYKDWGYAAGPTATRFMCEQFPKINKIYLLGFDLYGKENKINNVYKGTPCYASADYEAIFFKGWVKRLAEVFDLFPKTTFYRVGDVNDPVPEPWLKSNVLFISYPTLYSILRGVT